MNFGKILEDWDRKDSFRGRSWTEALDRYAPVDKDGEDSRPVLSRQEKERYPVQDELDLHGMILAQAVAALEDFLKESRSHGYRKVRVIHGKGHHSAGPGVLGPAVEEFLKHCKGVDSYGVCSRKEGGRGATWVWLTAPGK